MMRTLTLLILASALGLANGASANDSAMGGAGYDLVPERSTSVRMVSEEIQIDEVGEGSRWRVHARYVFRNASDEPVELTMGFPERRCDPDADGDCNGDGRFEQMQTFVRGVQVGERIGEVGARTPWRVELGRVFLFEVRFAARETVEIVHSYRVVGDVSVMGYGLSYVTRTGANWNGPIGFARFTVRLRSAPPVYVVPREYDLVMARHLDRTASGFGFELVYEQRDWVPRRNFSITVYSLMTLLEAAGCPWDHVPPSDEAATARRFDAATLRFCRNLPYARHGYPFRDRGLRRRLYRRGIRLESYLGGRTRFLEDGAFSESRLTSEDWAYIGLVRRLEALRAEQPR